MTDWLPLINLPRPITEESAPGLVASVVAALSGDDFAYSAAQANGGNAYGDVPFDGRGIVCCAGGDRYLVNAYVLIRSLRDLGCTLPIEVWYLGEGERREPLMNKIAEAGGVTFIDGRLVASDRRRRHLRLNGYEIKPYAVRFSRFREVLSLDADNVPVRDPSFLFDDPEYLKTGAVFWPDYGRCRPGSVAWKVMGDVPDSRDRDQESGQLLIDKARTWPGMLLANWYNVHSEFFFKFIHGDKDTWNMAFRKLGLTFSMPSRNIHPLPGTMCQHDFQGNRLFQHRNTEKWRLPADANKRIEGFERESECMAYLKELESLPSVADLHWQSMSIEDREASKAIADSRFLYDRIDHDRRIMGFESGGRISSGAAANESQWWLAGGELWIASEDGRTTCRLRCGKDGIWRGRWLVHEQMPVELVPLAASAYRPAFDVMRYVRNDDHVILGKNREYVLRSYDCKHRITQAIAPQSVMEIGVRAGYGAAAMLSAVPQASFLGIDNDQGKHGGVRGWTAKAIRDLGMWFPLAAITFREADSQTLAPSDIPACDLAHIDGDHSFDGCLSDLRLLAGRATWLLVDDYRLIGAVREAVDQFLADTGLRHVAADTWPGDMLIYCLSGEPPEEVVSRIREAIATATG